MTREQFKQATRIDCEINSLASALEELNGCKRLTIKIYDPRFAALETDQTCILNGGLAGDVGIEIMAAAREILKRRIKEHRAVLAEL